MAAEENTTLSTDLIAQSVDYTNQFSEGIGTLLKVLGVSRLTKLSVGSTIKIYKSVVTKAGGKVGEGETIPLSKVETKLADTKELEFSKWRKLVPAEAIQSAGFKSAVSDTDKKLLHEIHRDIKTDLFTEIAKGTGKANGTGFQSALANVLAQLSLAFEDTDIQSVAFVNPIDLYAYLGNTPITVQSVFGLQYIQNFLGFNVIFLTGSVKQGTINATASDNLNVYSANISGGSLGQAFDLVTDQTGLIGMTHTSVPDKLSYQTVIATALAIFPERLDGVFISTIDAPVPATGDGK